MSRIGKQPIVLGATATVTIEGKKVIVKGPKGELTHTLHESVSAAVTDGVILINVADKEDRRQRALWGLERSLVANMVRGVTEGYEKKLEIQGIGFRAELAGTVLKLHVGFTHSVDFAIPDGIALTVEKNIIIIKGIDKELVGSVAARIRAVKPPEPYKGKGIRYADEQVRRKAGKAAAAAK